MAGFGTQINFDINAALDEAEANGIFTAAEAEKIRKKNAASSNASTSTTGSQRAAAAGEFGKMISNADSQGTDTSSQVVGGAASGSASGFAIGGPWGAAIGGVIGGVQGALTADKNREDQNRKTEADRVANIIKIQSNATTARNNTVQNMISGLSRTLVSGR